MKNQPIIGMEIHVELSTNSKMFCGCPADHFAKTPNSQTCPVCLALPGAMPVPNQEAINRAITIGLALNCKIRNISKFDRKHYFYPDLPKGYQISQYDQPFCEKGYVTLDSGKKIGITRVHMEEDTAKLIHKEIKGKTVSLVDFNRSGVPLVEIVTEPDLETPEETKEFLKKIHHTIKTLDVSNADMEKGSMRLEANISIGDSANLPDYKVEIKNVNSFRYITNAISFEINRQAKLLKEGETPLQETRGWDRINGKTFSQRKKESADDYRYFPEPDILPIVTSNEQIEKLRSKLPQLPTEIIKNLTNLKIELRFAKHISQDKKIVDIIHELASDKQIDSNKLASLFVNAKLNPTDTSQSVKDSYLKQTKVGNTDQDLIGKLVKKVVGESEQAVLAYKQGNQNAIGPLIGKVIALSGGKVDPVTVRQSLVKTLSS
jgi:aspartyl-tRNA(Asn)/glutamyl-tRNA(Gln) amidotransferase subunit B